MLPSQATPWPPLRAPAAYQKCMYATTYLLAYGAAASFPNGCAKPLPCTGQLLSVRQCWQMHRL